MINVVNICHYCSGEANTDDHIIPLSKGGTNKPENIVRACGTCNSNKGSNSYEDFKKFMNFVVHERGYWKPLTKSQRKILKSRFLKMTGISIGTQ